jgi:hypothetical protein
MVKSEMVSVPTAKLKTVTLFPPSMITPLPKMERVDVDDEKLAPIAGKGFPVKLIVCPAIGEQSMISPSRAA